MINHKQFKKHRILAAGGIFLVLTKILFSLIIFYISDQVYAGGISTEQLLQCTNYYREQYGLPPVIMNSNLSKAALLKLEDIDQYNYWSHTNPYTNKQPWDFFDEIDYNYAAAGENLAFDYNTSAGVCKGWMDSESHRKNILSSDFNEVGFAIQRVDLEDQGEGNLIVQFFGSRINTKIDDNLLEQYRYKPQNKVCQTEIYDKLKIISPECGFVNKKNITIKAEILEGDLQNYIFKIDESDLDGLMLETGDNKIVKINKNIKDGTHKIIAQDKPNNEHAIVSFTVDTTSPIIDETKLKVSRTEKDDFVLFDIEIPIKDKNIDITEIFYRDIFGEGVHKEMQLLGESIYHVRISFPIKTYQEKFTASILATDAANNSSNISIDLYFPTQNDWKTYLAFIDYTQIWKYLLLSFILIVMLVFIYEIHASKNEKKTKEHQHHKYIQISFFIVLIISIILNFF